MTLYLSWYRGLEYMKGRAVLGNKGSGVRMSRCQPSSITYCLHAWINYGTSFDFGIIIIIPNCPLIADLIHEALI